MNFQRVTTSDTIELVDQSEEDKSTDFLSKNISSRFPEAIAAKLCRQFIDINRTNLSKVGVEARTKYDGSKVSLTFTSSLNIGAVPLLSPITSKHSISLLIKPRFGWNGIGSILQRTGWKEIPEILHLPQLTISERRIPQWVLSSVILHRLDRL